MAEMVGRSCSLPHKQGPLFGLIARIAAAWPKRASRIRTEDWPDYLLRDVGLSPAERDPLERRVSPLDWPMR